MMFLVSNLRDVLTKSIIGVLKKMVPEAKLTKHLTYPDAI